MKTRAVVIREMEKPRPYATSRPLSVEEVDLDPPGEGEVLVRIRAAIPTSRRSTATVPGRCRWFWATRRPAR
jgi:Zn-dependent alcohol dehydrogenase